MKKDTGKHYRAEYKGLKLDPARICQIYGVSSILQSQIIKKTLLAGKRGHKSILQDIDDIICSAERWKEMVIEDSFNFGRFDHVMLRSNNLKKSTEFYRDLLGFELLAVDERKKENGRIDYISLFFGISGQQGFKIEITFNPRMMFKVAKEEIDTLGHVNLYVTKEKIEEIEKTFANNGIKYDVDVHSHGEKKYIVLSTISPEQIKTIFIHKVEQQ